MLFDGVCVVGELFEEGEGVREGGGVGGVLIGMDAFGDGVECAGICEIKVGVEEDGRYGIEGCSEAGRGSGVCGRGSLEEAVPLWRDCAEVGVKVLAPYAGEVGGLDGWEVRMSLWWCMALVGVVEHV